MRNDKSRKPSTRPSAAKKFRGICMEEGIPTSNEFCPIGLPRWQWSPSGYHHFDVSSMVAAVHLTLSAGFNLPEFDLWLSDLGPCGARDELLQRRQLAVAAARSNNEEAMFRHLEWMDLRRAAIRREGFLLPLAKRDSLRQAGTGKPRGSRRPMLDAFIVSRLLANPGFSAKELWNSLPTEGDLYVEAEMVREPQRSTGRDTEGLTFAGFQKRVSALKNRRK